LKGEGKFGGHQEGEGFRRPIAGLRKKEKKEKKKRLQLRQSNLDKKKRRTISRSMASLGCSKEARFWATMPRGKKAGGIAPGLKEWKRRGRGDSNGERGKALNPTIS